MTPLGITLACAAILAAIAAVVALVDRVRSWPKPDHHRPGLRGMK